MRDEIVAVDKQYEKVWNEQDAEGVASFYTTDAKIMAAGMDVSKAEKVWKWYMFKIPDITMDRFLYCL